MFWKKKCFLQSKYYYNCVLRLLHKNHFHWKIKFWWQKHYPWKDVLLLLEDATKQKNVPSLYQWKKGKKYSGVDFKTGFLPVGPVCLLPDWLWVPVLCHAYNHSHLKHLYRETSEQSRVGNVPKQSLNYLHKWDAGLKLAFPSSVCVLRYLNNGLEKFLFIP